MLQKIASSLVGLALALSLTIAADPARANNIPGSASAAVPELTEVATGMIVRSIKDSIRPMRDEAGTGVTLSSSGVPTGFGASLGDGRSLSARLDYRDLDNDRLDGSLGAGSLLFGQQLDDRLLIFGGLLIERVDTDTLFNAGRIEASGAGLALGLDYRVSDRLVLTGIIGHMRLDYDVSRGGGAVTGSFDAKRNFIDLSGDYTTRAGNADLLLSFGLLYVDQKNDAYTESTGADVAAFTNSQFSGSLGARSIWGRPGDIRPYVDLETRFELSGNSGLPPALVLTEENDWIGRLGLGIQQQSGGSGFDLGIGANFGDGDFEGIDAKLGYTLRF